MLGNLRNGSVTGNEHVVDDLLHSHLVSGLDPTNEMLGSPIWLIQVSIANLSDPGRRNLRTVRIYFMNFHDIPMFPQKIEPFTHPLGPPVPLRLTGLPPEISAAHPRESQHGLGNPL